MADLVLGTPSHQRDPKRRWLRNRFQEGPGFRFLATRGGRPPDPIPRPDPVAVVRRRARALRIWREEGLSAALAIAQASRASLFRWRAAYAAGGLPQLCPERRGPRVPRLGYPVWVELVVIAVRLATYWNAKRIAAELRRRGIATVSHRWIERLFDQHGTARPSLPAERGPRYERGRPNELWHIDIKGPFFIQLASGRRLKTWIVGLVDDHSRFVLGLRIHSDTVLAPILAWLRERIDLCGIPLELMSDNGTPFVYWIPGVLTRFGRTLEELHIRHVRTQVNSPWTNGKVERSGASFRRRSSTARSSARWQRLRRPWPSTFATTTTTGSTARSAGSLRPSASTARPSATVASRTSRPSRICKGGWRRCVPRPRGVSKFMWNYT